MSRECENQKRKVERLRNVKYMEQAKQGVQSLGAAAGGGRDSDSERCDDLQPQPSNSDCSPRSGRPSSVASFASLSLHAKSIVSTFSCNGERELAEQHRQKKSYGSRIKHSKMNNTVGGAGSGVTSTIGVKSPSLPLRQRSPFRSRR